MTNPNPTNPSARRAARHYAVQAMYQWQLNDSAITDIEYEFLRYHITRKVDLEYFKELIHGVPKYLDEIDKEIGNFIKRTTIDEVDPIELAILRLATYELLKRPDVPYRVIINEALELTKKFGSIEGFKFVNGILDRIARQCRATEKGMEKDK